MANSELSQIFQKILLLGGCFQLDKTKFFSIYSVCLHLYFVFQLFCFCLGMVFYRHEIDGFAFDLGACISMTTTLLKIRVARGARYQRLVEEIFIYEDFMNKSALEPLREEYSRSTKRQTPIFRKFTLTILFTMVASYINAVFFILRYRPNEDPQNDIKRPIMIKVWIPMDAEIHYIAANLFYGLMVTIVGGVTVAVDFMMIYPIIYLICRIEMLKFVLQNTEKFLGGNQGRTRNENYFSVLIECVQEHELIIQKHGSFNRMMATIFFCDFLLRALQIAGFIFIIMSNILSLNNILYFGCVVFLLFQLFLQYWYGQVLIDESQSIPSAIYLSNWYTADVRSRRVMILMMLRSQKPLSLRIGSMGMVQLKTCIKILKTIYTIITIYSDV